MIPGVYGLLSASIETPIPMGDFQMNEILLAAAQSLMAVALLVGLRLDLKGTFLLFGLFIGQFLARGIMATFSDSLPFRINSESIHLFFSLLVVISIHFLLRNRAAVLNLHHGFKNDTVSDRLLPNPALVKSSPSSNRCINPEAVLESTASRSTYRR